MWVCVLQGLPFSIQTESRRKRGGENIYRVKSKCEIKKMKSNKQGVVSAVDWKQEGPVESVMGESLPILSALCTECVSLSS